MVSRSRYLTGPFGKRMRPKVIEFRRLTVTYTQQIILQEIDLDIFAGESVAILGAPGSGKSTLLACIQGQLSPSRGEITVLGTQVPPLRTELQHQIGSMPQHIAHQANETVAAYLQRFANYRAYPIHNGQIEAYCAHYHLSPSLPVAHLTNFQARLLSLALALIHDPPLALLDDPLAGLTEEDYLAFWPYIQRTQREGRTLLCTFTPPLAPQYFSGYDLIMRLEHGHLFSQEK